MRLDHLLSKETYLKEISEICWSNIAWIFEVLLSFERTILSALCENRRKTSQYEMPALWKLYRRKDTKENFIYMNFPTYRRKLKRSREILKSQEGQGVNLTQAKIVRAYGGCLGDICRWRTRQAAKSCGEVQMTIDPQISEWSNPAGFIPCHPYLRIWEGTGRTETSK